MMKQMIMIAGLVFGLMPVHAGADDFGARFSGSTPSALGGNITTVSGDFDPSTIEPAAGGPSADTFAAESIDTAPNGQTPEELISNIEKLMSEIETSLDENAAE